MLSSFWNEVYICVVIVWILWIFGIWMFDCIVLHNLYSCNDGKSVWFVILWIVWIFGYGNIDQFIWWRAGTANQRNPHNQEIDLIKVIGVNLNKSDKMGLKNES